MSSPLITAEIVTACRNGAGEAAEAWQRAFGEKCEFTLGEKADLLTLVAQDAWNHAGLAVVLNQAAGAYALLVADGEGALPGWIAAPDATGKSKLATLSQEFGMILLPEALMPTSDQTARLENLQEALLRCQATAAPEVLPLTIQFGSKSLPAVLIGVADHQLLLSAGAPAAAAPAISEPVFVPAAAVATPAGGRFANVLRAPAAPVSQDFEDGIPALPSYTRSLLKIKVPIVASLATTQLPVGRILEIGPGSIIQFDQSCEQPLSLAVGEHEFAVGEAVKVGEKFGLRITSMVMPSERFWSVRGQRE
ncbi:Flagellar motor switch protein FliN [Anatilimnocola aggregata]|uniref:Flagellar motor switch protein FliN n=1 Tax=Anatilimnocola aggregata TaxID=2528021 RepID=A0A517Y7U7_9BACT|nr:FliM/FliN family flagellar motor C-terminal domain-containing protein [Anatilimnocola aggregata]QDU26324.1 Flagellar motor switch protein FliN [Anatilimnocola aggregata]